jgi:hypothetical protein
MSAQESSVFEGSHGAFTVDGDTAQDFLDWREKNSADPYGAGIFTAAEDWMAEMEIRIKGGDTDLDEIAEPSFREINDGYTGFMYGAAAKVISECWVYGEDFRKAHNRRNTSDPERAEEVNEKEGAVINPALITIHTQDS